MQEKYMITAKISGQLETYKFEDYTDARKMADSVIKQYDAEKNNYPCETVGLEKICDNSDTVLLYTLERTSPENEWCYTHELQNREDFLDSMLDNFSVSLHKHRDGYEIFDESIGGSLYDDNTHYKSAKDVIERLSNDFFEAYFSEALDDLTDEQREDIKSQNITNFKDWLVYMDKHEDVKYELIGDYNAVDLIYSVLYEKDEINLDEIITEEIKDEPLYAVTKYYPDSDGGAFGSAFVTYETCDWSKVEELSHEGLMNRTDVEITDVDSGGSIRIGTEDYAHDLVTFDLCEFPYKPDDIKNGEKIIYESIDKEWDKGDRE